MILDKNKLAITFIQLCLVLLSSSIVVKVQTPSKEKDHNSISLESEFKSDLQIGSSPAYLLNSFTNNLLSGTYIVEITDLLPVELSVDQERFIFKACNTNSFPYEAHPDGSFKVTGSVISTYMFCSDDQDSQYVSAFTSATSFKRMGKSVTFYNKNNETVLTLSSEPKVSLSGYYRAEFSGFPNIYFHISDTHISFNGCNEHIIPYNAYTDGSFKLTGPGYSTNRACFANDYDRNYIEGLQIANSFTRVATTLTLFKSGEVIAVLQQAVNGTVSSHTQTASSASLLGNYSASFQQLSPINVSFSETTINFRGCNVNSIPYECFANGEFKITGPGISTLMYCENDKDSEYGDIFNSVTSYTKSGNTITLLGNGENLVTLIDTSSVIKASLVGEFYFSFAGFPSITLNFDGNRVNFEGCNINSASYEAYSDNSFKITSPFFTTRRACLVEDYDIKYQEILDSVSSFTLENDVLVLFSHGNIVGSSTTLPIIGHSLSLKGVYTAMLEGLPEIEIEIDESRIGFRGCNLNYLPYEAFSNGGFMITGPGISTLIACPVDYDHQYVTALRSATGFKITNDILTLVKENKVMMTLKKVEKEKETELNESYPEPKA